MSTKKTSEIALLAPRRAPLTADQEQQAVVLLAEVFLEAAIKRGLHSAVALDRANGGAIDSVVPFPEKRAKAHEAA